MAESFHKMFPVGDRPDYEPDADNSIAAIAEAHAAARRRQWRSTS